MKKKTHQHREPTCSAEQLDLIFRPSVPTVWNGSIVFWQIVNREEEGTFGAMCGDPLAFFNFGIVSACGRWHSRNKKITAKRKTLRLQSGQRRRSWNACHLANLEWFLIPVIKNKQTNKQSCCRVLGGRLKETEDRELDLHTFSVVRFLLRGQGLHCCCCFWQHSVSLMPNRREEREEKKTWEPISMPRVFASQTRDTTWPLGTNPISFKRFISKHLFPWIVASQSKNRVK